MKIKETSLTTICAILAVFGAGALQIAVALATIPNEGVRIAFCIAIAAAIIMDALVIHSIGTTPTNKVQKGVALGMLVALFIGLALDVVLLLTHDAFGNPNFGWMRAMVGVNIALTLVLAAAFFAFSDTNTHERQIKQLKHNSEMSQGRAFYESEEAAELYKAKTRATALREMADDLGLPISQVARYLGMSTVNTDSEPMKRVTSRPIPPPSNLGTHPEVQTNGHKQNDSFQ